MTVNCKGVIIDLQTPKVMGILNTTPDSFFDGGKYKTEARILSRAEEILSHGADFIDIGGYSSKPNADFVTESEELARLTPAISLIVKQFPEAIISVDTFRSNVARACVENGAALINDISAGHLDSNMLETIAKLNVPYVMMHMRGTPQTMQQLTQYDDLVKEMLLYFSERIADARELGIKDLIIDPGFGFAKTTSQNFELMQRLELLKIASLPMLIGISRKSMIYKTFESTPENALNGTTALHMIALSRGANILRVHDVKEAVECVRLFERCGE